MGKVLETMKRRTIYHHNLFTPFHYIEINMMNFLYIRMQGRTQDFKSEGLEYKQKKKKLIQISIHIASDDSRNIFKVVIKKLKLYE